MSEENKSSNNFWAKKFDTVSCIIKKDANETVCGKYKALLGNNYANQIDKVCPDCEKIILNSLIKYGNI
jgi:hypothetical protein